MLQGGRGVVPKEESKVKPYANKQINFYMKLIGNKTITYRIKKEKIYKTNKENLQLRTNMQIKKKQHT